MASRFTELAIDCADPFSLARFWCAALDYTELEVDEEEAVVTIGPAPTPVTVDGPVAAVLTFARVPEAKSVKNRLHLDLRPSDRSRDEEVERLIGLGAARADVGQGEQPWVVLADPEGNEFCVLGELPG